MCKCRIFLGIFYLTLTSAFPQSGHSDFSDALILCSNGTVVIDALDGPGNVVGEIEDPSCSGMPFTETNSIWFKWQAKTNGSLGFTILPLNEQDDIDFVLFRLESGWSADGMRTQLRCMASGKNFGDSDPGLSIPCTGATGLSNEALDVEETPGCRGNDDNFLSDLQVNAGEVFALFINNYYSSNGALVEFTGNVEFDILAAPCTTTDHENSQIEDIRDGGLSIKGVYPNPSTSIISTEIASGKAYAGNAQIIDSRGGILVSEAINIQPGHQTFSMPIGDLPRGVFFLKIKLDDNTYVNRFSKM